MVEVQYITICGANIVINIIFQQIKSINFTPPVKKYIFRASAQEKLVAAQEFLALATTKKRGRTLA